MNTRKSVLRELRLRICRGGAAICRIQVKCVLQLADRQIDVQSGHRHTSRCTSALLKAPFRVCGTGLNKVGSVYMSAFVDGGIKTSISTELGWLLIKYARRNFITTLGSQKIRMMGLSKNQSITQKLS